MGKIMYLGDEYSSDGTKVIPNPEGEATDDLNTVQIGEDIFNVVGSGSAGGSIVALPSLYSTKEKMVGLWTDNKPLYQKTFHIDSFTSTSWYSIDSNFTPDLYSIKTINSNGYVVNGGGYTNQRYTLIQTNGFWIRITQNSQGFQACIDGTPDSGVTRGNCDITVQYTKTADTPVEDFNLQDLGIFAPVIYSLEEREIGVWTDGKPLYQKTVDTGLIPSNTTKKVAHNVANIETIVKYYGIALNSSGSDARALPYVAFFDWNISLYVDETNISIYTVVNWENYYPRSYVTIQYTKTTDVAGSGSYAQLGVPAVHYDDTERVIGTWFGETLYRRSFVLTTAVTLSSSDWTYCDITFSSQVEIRKGDVYRPGNHGVFNPSGFNCRTDNHKVGFRSPIQVDLGVGSVVTLEYTKTTT